MQSSLGMAGLVAAAMSVVFSVASCNGSTASSGGDGGGEGDGSPAMVGPTSDSGGHTDDATSALPDDSGQAADAPLGCGSASAMPTTLAGTWDVLGSRLGNKPVAATLVIDASHFSFAVTQGDALAFAAQASALTLAHQRQGGGPPVAIATTHSSAPLAEGIIPLGLGGQWTFASSSAMCQASIAVPTFSVSCTGTSNFPAPLPHDINGRATGQQTSTLPSLFGDLGGIWHVSDGALEGCDATFSGNTLSATCKNAPWGAGVVTVTFCDGIAVGTTSAGVEFSAHRQ